MKLHTTYLVGSLLGACCLQLLAQDAQPARGGRGGEAAGSQNALWVEVNTANYKTAFPASGTPPTATSGGQIVKVSFSHTPGAYTPPNQLHWNVFDDGINKCAPAGARVLDDHIFASP